MLTADEQQQSFFTNFLNNFNVTHFQIGIILSWYQQPDQVLLNKKEVIFARCSMAFTDNQIYYRLLLNEDLLRIQES